MKPNRLRFSSVSIYIKLLYLQPWQVCHVAPLRNAAIIAKLQRSITQTHTFPWVNCSQGTLIATSGVSPVCTVTCQLRFKGSTLPLQLKVCVNGKGLQPTGCELHRKEFVYTLSHVTCSCFWLFARASKCCGLGSLWALASGSFSWTWAGSNPHLTEFHHNHGYRAAKPFFLYV